jgi:hypothetical protein
VIDVSIITVHKGEVADLRATFDSILQSSPCQSIEWIVMDASEEQHVRNIFMEEVSFDCNFQISSDSGPFDAMNQALKLARGRYVNFLNSGDCFAPGTHISNTGRELVSSNADWVVGQSYIINHQGKISSWKNPKKGLKLYTAINSYCHQSIFFKHEKIIKFGGFDVNSSVADWALILRFLNSSEETYTKDFYIIYKGGGMSSNPNLRVWKIDVTNGQRNSGLFSKRFLLFLYITQNVFMVLLYIRRIIAPKIITSNLKI